MDSSEVNIFSDISLATVSLRFSSFDMKCRMPTPGHHHSDTTLPNEPGIFGLVEVISSPEMILVLPGMQGLQIIGAPQRKRFRRPSARLELSTANCCRPSATRANIAEFQPLYEIPS